MTHPNTTTGGMDAILVVTDAPRSIEFGIDCITYETGANFGGVSMIPPGLHFFYHSTGMGCRQGFFLFAEKNEVIVKSWDTSIEVLLPQHNLSVESLENLHISLRRGDLNANLGPYPLQEHHIWINNSRFITLHVLEHSGCTPNTLIYPGDDTELEDQDFKSMFKTRNIPKLPDSSVTSFFADTAIVARFTDITSIEVQLIDAIEPGAERARTITQRMLDKSFLLEHLLTTQYAGRWQHLLGELQLSFLLFMLLFSYPGLNHWKLVVSTICSSDAFLIAHEVSTYTHTNKQTKSVALSSCMSHTSF